MKIFDKLYPSKKNYGLALSGGGARGFLHVGVLKRLEEKQITIDEVSGTSMGSIIAALIATGKSYDQIMEIITQTKFWKLIDLNFGGSILGGDKVYKLFDQIFGDQKIQDCKIPLKIVATDINKGEKYVFTKGYIKDAVRASISVPGIFKPHLYKGMHLVDGGLVDNLPISEIKSKKVIAVSANQRNDLEPIIGDGNFTIGIKKDVLLRSYVIMMKANEDYGMTEAKKENKDIIYLESQKYFKTSDFLKRENIINHGYELAKKHIK